MTMVWLRLALLSLVCGLSGAAFAQEPLALAKAKDKSALKELIAAALKEGQISYLDTVIRPTTNDALSAAFRAYYGLPASFKVNYTTMTPGNVITKLEQEIRAGRTSYDVGAVASPPWAHEQAKAGKILKYDSPEYAAFTRSFELGLGLPGYFAFNGAYYFVPMWNAESLDFKGTSWRDVLSVVQDGRFSTTDPSTSDSALMTYMGLRTFLGRDYFETVAKLKPSLLYKSETIAARLISGEDLFAMYGMPTRAYQFNLKGARLKFLTPSEGVVLLPQLMFILAGAQHPAAAKLWLDFVLSEPGQKILAEQEVLISGRAGFKSPLPDVVPSIDQVKAIKLDWAAISTADMQRARQEWLDIFKR
jgi:iron(III) transport system substrate-binding protein